MLYPLSYGGARAQSSDLAFIRGGREWPMFTYVTRTAVRPAQDHTRGQGSIGGSVLAQAAARIAGAGRMKAFRSRTRAQRNVDAWSGEGEYGSAVVPSFGAFFS